MSDPNSPHDFDPGNGRERSFAGMFLGRVAMTAVYGAIAYGVLQGATDLFEHHTLSDQVAFPAAVVVGSAAAYASRRR